MARSDPPAVTGTGPDTLAPLRRVSTATLAAQRFKRGLRNTLLHGVRRTSEPAPNGVGVYPPDEATRARYAARRRKKGTKR